MPVISVQMTKENGGLSKAQKEELIEKLTKSFVEVVGRGQSTCVVLINEIPTDSYAIGGKSIEKIRRE